LRFMSTGTPSEEHGPTRVDHDFRRVREKPKAVPNHDPVAPPRKSYSGVGGTRGEG
jgi:hypothetical protein